MARVSSWVRSLLQVNLYRYARVLYLYVVIRNLQPATCPACATRILPPLKRNGRLATQLKVASLNLGIESSQLASMLLGSLIASQPQIPFKPGSHSAT